MVKSRNHKVGQHQLTPTSSSKTVAKFDINVSLIGRDGNSFSVLSTVTREMRKHGIPKETIDEYVEQATAGDYNHLLSTTNEWVNVV